MLLEYSQDTDELELKNKAIELRRRVAGRKLEQSIVEGIVDADGLIELKELNRAERQTHMNETVEIINASVKERIALNRADQHLVAVGQVKTLERDISRASRLGKARFDALDDLEKRVKQMRSLLHHPTFQTIDTTITTELLANPKLVKLEKQFQQCSICNRRILVNLLDGHLKMCEAMKSAKDSGKEPEKEKLKQVFHVEDTLITSLATFKPHPPRNFRVIGKGITYIEWVWDPPVIDGGLEITEYEISYHVKHTEFDYKANKFIKWEEDNTLTTSHWLFRDHPVCHTGFKMCNLRANSEYSHFKIRAYNLRGWSEWEKMQESDFDKIVLAKEIPPTQPLFVTCDLITSTCLHISWSPPLFDGGLPILDYIVYYTVIEMHHTVTERAKKVEKHLSFSTDSSIPNTVIRNLPDNTDVVHIYVCAKNQGRLIGAKGFCKQTVCRTKRCSRYTQLIREIEYAMSSNNPWIDSDFFTGVKQRLNRVEHIKHVREELEVTEVDPLEQQEANEWTVLVEKRLLKKKMEEEALKTAKEVEMMSRFKTLDGLSDSDEESDGKTLRDKGDSDENEDAHSISKQSIEDEYEEIEVEIEVPVDGDEKEDIDLSEATSALRGEETNATLTPPPPPPGMKRIKVKRKVKKQPTMQSLVPSVSSHTFTSGKNSSINSAIEFTKRKLKNQKKQQKQKLKEQQQRLQGHGFTFIERRTHFQKKLLSYDKKTEKLQQEKMYIDKLRVENTSLMRRKEKKLLSYQLEKERLKNYTGKTITSSVLTGADMQFKIADYLERLNYAYETIISEIAEIKYQIISNENRRLLINQELIRNEEEKKDRLAKYHEFENQFTKTMKIMHRLNLGKQQSSSSLLAGDMQSEKVERERILRLFFRKLYENKLQIKQVKQRTIVMLNNWLLRYKRNAFNRLKYGKFYQPHSAAAGERNSLTSASSARPQNNASSEYAIRSVGGVLLQKAFDKRIELQEELREVISDTSIIKQQLKIQCTISQSNYKKLKSNESYSTMEEGLNHHNLFHYQGIHILYEANAMAEENKFELAARLYEAQILSIRSKAALAFEQLPNRLKSKLFQNTILSSQDIKLLSICHGKLGQMFIKMQEIPRGIVEFDRQLSLAREIQDKSEEADAFYGLGIGYLYYFDYENALRYLLIAQGLFLGNHRVQRYYLCLQSIKECYIKLHRDDKIAIYNEKLANTEQTIHAKFQIMHTRLRDMQLRLAHTSAEIEHVIPIERTTFMAMEYRKFIKLKEEEIEKLEEEKAKQDVIIGKIENILDAIQKEMQAAIETDELEIWSELVHETPQVVEVEELKQRLKQRTKVELEELKLQRQVEGKILLKIRNIENEIEEKQQLLSLEEGNLMKHSRFDKPFRCIGLCLSNAIGNEVTGTATGGYEEFLAAEGNNVHVIDYHSGGLQHIFRGTVENAILYNAGNSQEVDNRGHSGVVTCLLHDGALIFTGATDEKIICWNTVTRNKVRVLVGHEGSIVALASENKYLISSAADVTMRLWMKSTGDQVRVIFGHSKSVLSMEIGPKWLLTGSADHEVRVWKIEEKSKTKVDVTCSTRLKGHECPVTCVRYGAVEVLSGDARGRVFLWWLKTGTVIRKCEIHQGLVKCLQFDAVHIVTGGTDNCVCVTDIASGEVLVSLRGHENHVLALAFDSERILSVGGDNTIRYWAWGKKTGPQDKIHVLEPNQTLAMVSKEYQIPIDQLMKWNGIKNNRHIYTGMKLIVKKGDPDKLTDAERITEEREMRKNRGLALTNQKLLKANIELKSQEMSRFSNKHLISDPKYSRIHSLAMNMDYFSLGNRLFGNDKRKLDLFPDQTNDNEDNYSLAARIELGMEEKADESIVGGTQHYLTDGVKPVKQSKREKDFRQHLKKVRYYLSAGNEDEWGEVSDTIGLVMLDMMIELTGYDIVLEQKRELRDKQSVIGRIYQYQNQKKKTVDEKKKKNHTSKVKWGKRKKKRKQDGMGGGESVTTGSEETGSLMSGEYEESSTDEEGGGRGGSGSDVETSDQEKGFGAILHSREEMKPIPEEEEAEIGESSRKVKKEVLEKQEAAISQYFNEIIHQEKEKEKSASSKESFLPAIHSKDNTSAHETSNRSSIKEEIKLPPL